MSLEIYNKTPVLCCEIGSAHESNNSLALQMIKEAAKAGVDCIKLQCYQASEFVHPIVDLNLFERILSLQFTKPQWIELANACNDVGIPLFASVFGPFGIEVLREIDAPYIKIASGDFNHIYLIKQAIKTNISMILATGMSSWNDVRKVENLFQNYPPFRLPLYLHCVSKYPNTNEEASLGTIEEGEKFTGRAWGYSDHVPGIETCKKAMFMGATFIEKHFTLTPEIRVGDHSHSATLQELIELREWRDHVLDYFPSIPEASPSKIGLDLRNPAFQTIPLSLRPDLENREKWRRALYAFCAISKGKEITLKDLSFLRPSFIEGVKGMISCSEFERVIGKVTKQEFQKGEPIVWGGLKEGNS